MITGAHCLPQRLAAAILLVLSSALAACGPATSGLPQGNDRGITSPLAWPASVGQASQVAILRSGPARYVETRSHRAVTVAFDALDHAAATRDAAAYTLRSQSDPAYGAPVGATKVGSDQQAVGFDAARQTLVEARLHLLFPYPLQAGHDYQLDVSAAVPGRRVLPLVVRHAPDRVSGSIQANQVGYTPRARKLAYLGNWLGTAGPLPVDLPGFEVVDVASGETVLRGRAVLLAAADPWSGNDVWEADFSTLTAPGRYRLRVPGLGGSDVFTIAADVNDRVYRTLARLFYHSRNSTPVLAPWADPGFERPAGGIPADRDGAIADGVGSSPLGRGEPAGSRHAVSRGWFDAGDYGQYVPNAAPVWYQVGAGLDIAPDRFRDGDLDIPESGNGIPDVLDELEWGLDWLLSMQDPADGGVYFRIASRRWDETPPHEVAAPRLIAEKTTHATAAFAAACALHARLIRPYRPERAQRALDAARAAWQFLESHPQWPEEGQRYRNPPGIHAGEYADASARDNLLWAAAELHRATGEVRYREAYEAAAPQVGVDPSSGVSYRDLAIAALWAYVMSPADGADAAQRDRARRTLVDAADWYVRKAVEHPFRAPMHQHIGYVGWGSFARSTRATLPLLQAHRLTGAAKYLEWAWQTTNPQLGANPQGLSYVTGIGIRSPLHPLSKLSRFAHSRSPLPGIPVHGPHFRLPALWKEMAAVGQVYVPPGEPEGVSPRDAKDFAAAYPALRRYTDSAYLPPMSEPTIAEYAEAAVAFALLRDENLPWDATCGANCERAGDAGPLRRMSSGD